LAVQIDLKSLQRHYASLLDDELLALNRAELVELAQTCYDQELAKRNLTLDHDAGDQPDWLEEADCACTFSRQRENQTPPDAENALDVLTAAGIPCHLVVQKMDPPVAPEPWYEYRLMVPGNFNMQASSVLDKEIFNSEIEAGWRTYFESLSDEELQTVDTEELFGGLRDRLERATKAYQEALNTRGISVD
jgi:hypothetical protein